MHPFFSAFTPIAHKSCLSVRLDLRARQRRRDRPKPAVPAPKLEALRECMPDADP